MKRILVLALLATAGTAAAQSLGDTTSNGSPVAATTSGEQTYREICQACHMAEAEGGTGPGAAPALAANPRLADPDYVLTRILRGRAGMPAFAELFTAEQTADVANYVRTHFRNAYPGPVSVADVARLAPSPDS